MASLLHTAVWSWTVYSGFSCHPSGNYFSCSCKQLKVPMFPNLFSNHLYLISSPLTKLMIRNKEWKPLEFDRVHELQHHLPDPRRFTAWHIWHKWKAFQVLLLVDLIVSLLKQQYPSQLHYHVVFSGAKPQAGVMVNLGFLYRSAQRLSCEIATPCLHSFGKESSLIV